jgi:hypothetical protein
MRTVFAAVIALGVLVCAAGRARAAPDAEGIAQARLEQVRQDPRQASDPAAIEALARDAEGFPEGPARVGARLLVATAWLERLHRTDDGVAEMRKVVDDPAADPTTSRFAEKQVVDALVDQGRVDAAVVEAHARADRLDPRFVVQVDRLVRRRSVRRLAAAVLGLFVLLASTALIRAARRGSFASAVQALRGFAPLAAVFVAFVGAAGGGLAASYETGNAAPFLLFGSVALPLVLLARAWAAVGSEGARARALRAGVCAGAALAAAFVVLDVLGVSYLQGFGL